MKRKLLVIDDDPEWQDYVRAAVSGEYDVLSTFSGEDAPRMAEQSKPDAIILDVMMPDGRDGFSTFCALKKNPRTKNIPIVMLTHVNEATKLAFSAEEMKQYLGEQPSAFLEKPISPDRLLEEIKHAVMRRS